MQSVGAFDIPLIHSFCRCFFWFSTDFRLNVHCHSSWVNSLTLNMHCFQYFNRILHTLFTKFHATRGNHTQLRHLILATGTGKCVQLLRNTSYSLKSLSEIDVEKYQFWVSGLGHAHGSWARLNFPGRKTTLGNTVSIPQITIQGSVIKDYV